MQQRSILIPSIVLFLATACSFNDECGQVCWGLDVCECPDDEAGDGEPELVPGQHSCSPLTGNCLLDEVDGVPYPGFFRGELVEDACEVTTSRYPCGDFVTATVPLDATIPELAAFDHVCGTCPPARTTTNDPAFFANAEATVYPLTTSFACTYPSALTGDYFSFGNGLAASYNGNFGPYQENPGVQGFECQPNESEYPLRNLWCGFGDAWCTSLCNKDSDCADGYATYMTSLLGPGEAQCVSWPMEVHFDGLGQPVETPHGCAWNTGNLVIPPAPAFGGMLVEQELLCIDNVCDVSQELLDAIASDPAAAAIGLSWTTLHDGSLELDVKSHAYAQHIGLRDGDVVRAVGLASAPVSIDALLSAIEELAAGETSFAVQRGRERVEFVIVVAD
jgi:hypothetical protein